MLIMTVMNSEVAVLNTLPRKSDSRLPSLATLQGDIDEVGVD